MICGHRRQLWQVLDSGLGGTLTSANYPDNYEHNTDCSFTITPIPGNSVTIEFQVIVIMIIIFTMSPILISIPISTLYPKDFHVDYSHGGGCMDFLTVGRSCLGSLVVTTSDPFDPRTKALIQKSHFHHIPRV